MKMQNAEMEFVAFDEKDVIVTSGFGAGTYAIGQFLPSAATDNGATWRINSSSSPTLNNYYLLIGVSSITPGVYKKPMPKGGSFTIDITDVGTVEPFGEGVNVLPSSDAVVSWLKDQGAFQYQ